MTAASAPREIARVERDGEAPWSRGQRAKNELIYIFAKVLFALLPFVPRGALRLFGRAVGALAFLTHRASRRVALANLSLAFPAATARERRAMARAAYHALGRYLGDSLAVASGRAPDILPFAPGSRAVVERAVADGRGRADGKGVVLVSAHLGPWESVAASLAAHGVPLVTLARAPYDRRLAFVFERLRGGAHVRAIDRGAPGATARIVRTLRSGEVLGAPMDLRARVPSVTVPFLGHPASTPVGPARLALRTNAAVVVVTAALSDPGNVQSSLCLRAERVELTPNMGPMELTERLNDVLSARIRAFPSGWVWMHDRFAKGPPTPA